MSYRVQVNTGGRFKSETFPNRRKAQDWATKLEAAIREGQHFPHAAARRTGCDALAKDYEATLLPEIDETQRATRVQQLILWAERFTGKTLAEITPEGISKARYALAAEHYTKGKPRTNKKTGAVTVPMTYPRNPATVNRYNAGLSAIMTFAVKERGLLDRNAVSNITCFLSDGERRALLNACAESEWASRHALVLLAITTGARRGELTNFTWDDVDTKAGRALVCETKKRRTANAANCWQSTSSDTRSRNHARGQAQGRAERLCIPNPSGREGAFTYFDTCRYEALERARIP